MDAVNLYLYVSTQDKFYYNSARKNIKHFLISALNSNQITSTKSEYPSKKYQSNYRIGSWKPSYRNIQHQLEKRIIRELSTAIHITQPEPEYSTVLNWQSTSQDTIINSTDIYVSAMTLNPILPLQQTTNDGTPLHRKTNINKHLEINKKHQKMNNRTYQIHKHRTYLKHSKKYTKNTNTVSIHDTSNIENGKEPFLTIRNRKKWNTQIETPRTIQDDHHSIHWWI